MFLTKVYLERERTRLTERERETDREQRIAYDVGTKRTQLLVWFLYVINNNNCFLFKFSGVVTPFWIYLHLDGYYIRHKY